MSNNDIDIVASDVLQFMTARVEHQVMLDVLEYIALMENTWAGREDKPPTYDYDIKRARRVVKYLEDKLAHRDSLHKPKE